MALDVGQRRIGVALSDPTRLLATPLATLQARPRERALAQIESLVRQNEVAQMVVGLPLTMSGEHGSQAQFVQAFAEELGALLAIPISYSDERLTTVAAERLMMDLGLRPEQRRARIDEMAAAIILQDFLDAQRGDALRLPAPEGDSDDDW